MRSFRSYFFTGALIGLFGAVAVAGCSADGSGGDFSDTTPNDPVTADPTSTSRLPAPGANDNGVQDGGIDSSKPDAKTGATFDAGPPPPVPGTSCSDLATTVKRTCGICGTQEALCEDDGKGTLTWSDYGACGNERTFGCNPGEIVHEACGHCGTTTKTCSKFCAFTSSVCAGEPGNNCAPGTVQYTTGSCVTPATFKNRTCTEACVWGAYSGTCKRPVNDIVVDLPATVGATATRTLTFTEVKAASRIDEFDACPQGPLPMAGSYPYQYVELHNPNAQAATVTVYNSAVPGGNEIATVMVGYTSPLEPASEFEKRNCAFGPNDESATNSDVAAADVALTGGYDFAVLRAVPIPAGDSVLVYVGSTYETTDGTIVTGDLAFNARLEALH